MSRFFFVIPVASEDEAQTYTDANNIEFECRIWRHNIPDPPITDWGMAIKCGDGVSISHLFLWGDLLPAKAAGLRDNVTGCVAYPSSWNRRTVLNDLGLVEMEEVLPEEDHDHVMPIMHKIWDYADAPFPVLAAGEDEPFNVLPGIVASRKLDGYTCGVRFNNGSYVKGITQGDSQRGIIRTSRLGTMVPATIPPNARIQIEGEVVTNRSTAAAAHFAMHQATQRQFFGLECKLLAFDFRAVASPFTEWSAAMVWLDSQEFDTVLNYAGDNGQDGIVYRIDNYAAYQAEIDAGNVAQFAFKFPEG